MTTALAILIAWPIASVVTAALFCRMAYLRDHPRRGEGENQSARQDRGEGLGFETTHNGGINS